MKFFVFINLLLVRLRSELNAMARSKFDDLHVSSAQAESLQNSLSLSTLFLQVLKIQ